MRRGFIFLAALWLAGSAGAQQEPPIYKYRLPDGSTLYSDEPSSRGSLQEMITPPPAAASAPQADEPTRAQAQAEREAAERASTLDAAKQNLNTAQDELANAEAALHDGLEPLPGERLGNTNGSTRLAPAYWQRVALLRAAVEQARTRVADANAELDALR
jgi:hypothetical protein